MEDREDEINSLLGAIIQEGFPELIGEEITLEIASKKKRSFYMKSEVHISKNAQTIIVAWPYMDNCSLIGYLAHELAHGSRDLQLSKEKREYTYQLYKANRTYRVLEERQVDFDVITSGFGDELLQATLKYPPKGKCPGLSAEEIRKLLNDIRRIEQ